MTPHPGPVSILIAALGGEGGGVLAEWLVTAATRAGFAAQSTSIPGVAQRTGATTYYVEIYPVPLDQLGGRIPVLGLLPVPGNIDLIVASELLETGRVVQAGLTSPERTFLITSTSRTLTTEEKMALGDGRFDSDLLLDVVRRHTRDVAAFDFAAVAREAGTVVSAVMFGAIAASGVLPFARDVCAAVIEGADRSATASRAGFVEACARMDRRHEADPGLPAPVQAATIRADAIDARVPAAAREMVALGLERVTAYQDRAYGELYLDRLDRVIAAERVADPAGVHGSTLTREAARYLALWMAFDDVVRIADLKSRASRFARVRREAAAGESDVVRIFDYLKPGLPEAAGLLPPGLAARLVAWERRRTAHGKRPFAVPLSLRSDSVRGFLVLRTLASLRGLRRRGARYAAEQAGIERWLGCVTAAAAEDWQLAYEIALCARLVKGYGATLERGKENLLHILAHLVETRAAADVAARAMTIRDGREAALADEGGVALDRTLAEHGAPVRPIKAHPIRFATARSTGRKNPAETVS